MSLFGALNTAVSGLSAQSAAFGNISDNVANSQTTGYKAVDTSFIDYLTSSTATNNQPGSVSAIPNYTNNVQGTISQSDDPLAMAISGQGFFAVSEAAGVTTTGAPNFSSQTYYTQAGDFQLNDSAYLVNGAGQYLQGWTVNPQTGVANQSTACADRDHPDPVQPGTHRQHQPVGQPAGHTRGWCAGVLADRCLRLARQRAHAHAELDAESQWRRGTHPQ